MINDRQLTWRRSSRCGSNTCLEMAHDQRFVYVVDSANPTGAVLCFPVKNWVTFVDWVSSVD